MSSKFIVPKDVQVQEMLSMLYGSDLTIKKSVNEFKIDSSSKAFVAIFLNDQDLPVTTCICDFGFAGYAGGALTKIPKGGVEDAVESGDFSGMLLSNLNEVMNICSRLFMDSNTDHLRLDTVSNGLDGAPDEIKNIISSPGIRSDFDIEINGYGSGVLSFLV